jgi:hypothetical protein
MAKAPAKAAGRAPGKMTAKAVSAGGRAAGKSSKTAAPRVVSAGKNNVRTKQTNLPQTTVGKKAGKVVAKKGVPLNQSALGRGGAAKSGRL